MESSDGTSHPDHRGPRVDFSHFTTLSIQQINNKLQLKKNVFVIIVVIIIIIIIIIIKGSIYKVA